VTGVGQEDAELAVLDLAEPAAPLPLHAAGITPRLGEGAGVEHEHGLGVARLQGDVPAQFGHHGLVVPAAGADEVLHGLARAAGLVGDGLRGLALQAAELALQDHPGQLVLLDPVEARQVARQEALQAAGAAGHGGGGDLGVGKQGLGRRVVEQRHPCRSGIDLPDQGSGRLAYLPEKNGYSPTTQHFPLWVAAGYTGGESRCESLTNTSSTGLITAITPAANMFTK